MKRPDLYARLKRTQRQIISIKRAAKRAAGSNQNNWPDSMRARYEELCDRARSLQEWMSGDKRSAA